MLGQTTTDERRFDRGFDDVTDLELACGVAFGLLDPPDFDRAATFVCAGLTGPGDEAGVRELLDSGEPFTVYIIQ
jgi:hypothetical protein